MWPASRFPRLFLDKLPSSTASPEGGRGGCAVTGGLQGPWPGGPEQTCKSPSEHAGLAIEGLTQGAGLSYVTQRPACGGPHRGVLTLASAPPPGRVLRLRQTPWVLVGNLRPLLQSLWDPPNPCTDVWVCTACAVGGKGENADGQSPPGHILQGGRETSGICQLEAAPSGEEKQSGEVRLPGPRRGAASASGREFSLQGWTRDTAGTEAAVTERARTQRPGHSLCVTLREALNLSGTHVLHL